MREKIIRTDTGSTIQKKTGFILFTLTFATGVLNFLNGLINYGETPATAFTNVTVLPILISSLLLLATALKDSAALRCIQVCIIFAAGFATVILNTPGNITGVLILFLGMALAYKFGFFASGFYIKILVLFILYLLITFGNVFLVYRSNLPFGIPSILFSLTALYLFCMVFSSEIKRYLIRTNQLKRKLNRAESENVLLGQMTASQAELIEDKNRALKENLEEKTQIAKELTRTLSIKNVLLQEVHHRVKNNLAVIISLFNLQQSDNAAIQGFININSTRLHAMAAVHEIIYQNESFESVDLKIFFADILKNTVKMYSEGEEIQTFLDMESISVKTDIAVPLGIVLNDCVSNLIVYGFSGKKSGKTLSVNLRKDSGITMIITDNGAQISLDATALDHDLAFSIKLIKLLAEDQLKGSFEMKYHNGNQWIILIPLQGTDS